jgi:hypothetical protein
METSRLWWRCDIATPMTNGWGRPFDDPIKLPDGKTTQPIPNPSQSQNEPPPA